MNAAPRDISHAADPPAAAGRAGRTDVLPLTPAKAEPPPGAAAPASASVFHASHRTTDPEVFGTARARRDNIAILIAPAARGSAARSLPAVAINSPSPAFVPAGGICFPFHVYDPTAHDVDAPAARRENVTDAAV